MPNDESDCHLCHLHDHNSPSTLLRTSTLRDHSPQPPRRHRHHHNRHHNHHNHHGHHHNHPRSRSGSIDNAFREHHRQHSHAHQMDRQKMNRVPSALARLSEHSVAQSLPASRSNTLRLYPEQISVLPDGGHRYIGGDRASVHSLELTSPMHAVDNRSHLSLIQTSTLQKPTVTMNPDMLTTSLPPLRSHGSQLSLNAHNTPAQGTPADYFMHRLPFKDAGRKNRFNLQAVMLIGCYTLLFVMAIVIGVVLSYQNGWLGFGSPDTLDLGKGKSLDNPSSNSVLGGSSTTNLRGESTNNVDGNELDRLKEDAEIFQPPVHNVVQVRDPNAPRTNFAGILTNSLGEGRPRSITGTDSNGVRNIQGKRPAQTGQDIIIPQQAGGILDSHPNLHSTHIVNNQHQPQNVRGGLQNPSPSNNGGLVNPSTSSHNVGLNNQQQNNRELQNLPTTSNNVGLNNQQPNNRGLQNLPTSSNNVGLNNQQSNNRGLQNLPTSSNNVGLNNQQSNNRGLQNPSSSSNNVGLNNQQSNNRGLQNPSSFSNNVGLNNQQENGNIIPHFTSPPIHRQNGVPLPTLINTSPDVPVPFLVPTGPRITPQQQPSNVVGGKIPGNAITTNTGRIIINAPPPRNPFNIFPSNIQNSNSQQGFPRQNPGTTSQIQNVKSLADTNFQVVNKQQDNPQGSNANLQISLHGFGNQNQFPPNANNGALPNNFNTDNEQGNKPINDNQFAILENQRAELGINHPLIRNTPQQVLGSPKSPQIKGSDRGVEFNKIHMEKMKMLKEILDSEGSGKLLQDLITLKNNRNSLNTISQHLSEVAGQGPSASINPSPASANVAGIVTPAILKHRDQISESHDTPTFPPKVPGNKPVIIPIDEGKHIVAQTKAPQDTSTSKPKSNIQVVRELLASLINSPEVQEILASRNKQRAERKRKGGVEGPEGRVKVKGDEMREILLKALAKELPSGQSLQRLRLHGPQPSETRQSAPRNRVPARRGQKTVKRGKITRAQQLVHFNTTTPSRTPSSPRGTLASRVLHNRMGFSENNKKLTSIEHQSVKPPTTRRIQPKRKPIILRTSRGRQKPVPHFRLRVKSDGTSSTATATNTREVRAESVEMKKREERAGDGEVVRHWRHMDNDGTVSLGTVRRDGSFAFTNCIPVEMCGNKNKEQ